MNTPENHQFDVVGSETSVWLTLREFGWWCGIVLLMVTTPAVDVANGQSQAGAPGDSAASRGSAAEVAHPDSGLILVGQMTIDRAMVARWLAAQVSAARPGLATPEDDQGGANGSIDAAGPDRNLSTLEWAVLGNLVRRAVALERLRALGGRALEDRVERRWQQVKALRNSRELGGEVGGAQGGLLRLDRTAVAWELAWNEYLRQQLTEENMERFFRAFHWRYDGTEARVRQIFLPHTDAVDGVAVADAPPALSDRDRETGDFEVGAEELLQQIATRVRAGDLSFTDAAREYSRAPSGREGGLLGWVTGQGDLPPQLSETALTGALSEPLGPVRTQFGWHLLWVEERRPVQVDFVAFENREALRSDAVRYLFDRLVREGLEQVEVRWHPSFSPPANLSLDRLLATP